MCSLCQSTYWHCYILTHNTWPFNGIWIKFETQPKFGLLYLKIYSTNHNKIFHMSQQLHCHDMCNISLWSGECNINQSTANFGRVSNLIEIWLVGHAPGLNTVSLYHTLFRLDPRAGSRSSPILLDQQDKQVPWQLAHLAGRNLRMVESSTPWVWMVPCAS